MSASTVVVGFGVVGVSVVRQLLRAGTAPEDVVVVDVRQDAVEEATALGVRALLGSGTDRAVLAQAAAGAGCVVVAVGEDAAAVLVTMMARDLCPAAKVHTVIRDAEHTEQAKRAGADDVVAPEEWVGRLLAFVIRPRS